MAKYQTGFNNYQLSKFIVTQAGDGPFTTIQLAIDTARDEAIATGVAQTVFIRTGRYIENLTHYANVNIVGSVEEETIIQGQNTISITGSISFSDISFESDNPFIGGGATITANFNHCIFNTTSYLFNIDTLSGTITLKDCIDVSVSASFVLNTKGTVNFNLYDSQFAGLTIYTSTVGDGTHKGGDYLFVNTEFSRRIEFYNASTVTIKNSFITDQFTGYPGSFGGCSFYIKNSYLYTNRTGDTGACIDSAGAIIDINDSTIDALGTGITNYAITGASQLILNSVTFIRATKLDPLLTITRPSLFTTGTLQLNVATVGILQATAGLVSATALTSGQLMVGSTGNPAVAANLSAGAGISITNGAGTISIATTAIHVTWSNISASGNLVVNTGVNCTGGAALSLALPATSAVGDIIEIALDGSTSWTVTQAANQQIRVGSVTSTLGVGGTIASTAQGDSIKLVCKTANLVWTAVSMIGNLTVV